MPRKKRNWELEYKGIHNTPEQFYYQFGKTTLYSDSLFKTPDIITTRVLQGDVVDKVIKWEKDNNITKTERMEWVELINPITDLLRIPKKTRKELFSDYKETQIVKLKQSIDAIEKAEKRLGFQTFNPKALARSVWLNKVYKTDLISRSSSGFRNNLNSSSRGSSTATTFSEECI